MLEDYYEQMKPWEFIEDEEEVCQLAHCCECCEITECYNYKGRDGDREDE